MKYLSSLMTLLCLIFVGGGMSSCSDDPVEPVDPTKPATAELALGQIGTNAVELKLTTTNVQEYAYQVTANMTESAPTATVLFGTGTKGVAVNGENAIQVKGLEGDTEYQVFLATKSEKGFGDVLSKKFRTVKYTELITFVDADFHSIKFHIEVPKDKIIGYAVVDRTRYYGNVNFGSIDPSYLNGAKEMCAALTESGTVTFEGWWSKHPDTDEDVLTRLLPGQAVALICGEVVEGKPDFYGRETWEVLFDFPKYWSGQGGPGPMSGVISQESRAKVTMDECWKTEYHQTLLESAKPTDKMPNTHVDVDIVAHTTRTIDLALTPDPELLGYGSVYMDLPAWETLLVQLGEEGALTWLALEGMVLETAPRTLQLTELKPDVTYRLILCGIGNEERTLRSVDYFDFTGKTATKEAPKIVVKGIKAPAGEVESPEKVWFNVKAIGQDIIEAKYLCNYTRDWSEVLGAGMTYTQMIEQQGRKMQQGEVNEINSDAGYNVWFPCREDSETRFVVCGYNDEMTANNPDTDSDCRADMRSIVMPDAPRVESTLFTDLVGDWTATVYTYIKEDDMNPNSPLVPSETPIITKITVSASPTHPSTCPESVYALYPDLSKAEVDALFDSFIDCANKYTGKVRGQNRLLCEGLNVSQFSTPYKTPWELFIDPRYNAYSADDLFYDFGPKWYLEIANGDQVTVPVDLKMPPVTSWYMDALYMVGAGEKTFDDALKSFSVTVSADKQTLTVNPAVGDGETLYPALASISQYGANIAVKCHSIVMTKGWTEQSAAKATRRASLKNVTLPSTHGIQVIKAHHKTRLSKIAPKAIYKTVELKPFSMVDYMDTLEKEANKANR